MSDSQKRRPKAYRDAALYTAGIVTGAFTLAKSQPTPKQRFRYIKWPGMSTIRVALKRSV